MSKKILIIGAGPTGLTAASIFSQYGIKPDIVDLKSGINDESKALAINPAALSQLDRLLNGHVIGNNANEIEYINVIFNNKRISKIKFTYQGYNRYKILCQPQSKTENELNDFLINKELEVEWSTRVHKIEKIDGLYCVHFDRNGELFSRNYEYVIGADGKRSIVKEKILQKDQESISYNMHLSLSDYHIESDLPTNSVSYFIYDHTFIVVVPLGGKKFRFVVKHDGAPLKNDNADLKVKVIILKNIEGLKITSDSTWFSQASLYNSISHKLSQDNLFIIGDAAHLYPPIGGTGMNTGIMDAVNLSWKLAFEINGYSKGANLLTSFQEERGLVIRNNSNITDHNMKLISRIDVDEQNTSRYVQNYSNRNNFKTSLPLNISGFANEYSTCEIAFGNGTDTGKQLPACEALLSECKSKPYLINIFFLVDNLQDYALACEAINYRGACITIVCNQPELENSMKRDVPQGYNYIVKPNLFKRTDLNSGIFYVIRPDGCLMYSDRILNLNGFYIFAENFLIKRNNS